MEQELNRTFLFHGPSGCGKTTLSRIAAGFVGANASSIREIDAATFTGIDAMREVTASLSYKPLGGVKARALIVDECHRLSSGAWDSLLKALEEPPAGVYWFLCTTNLAKVPRTVQTRCLAYQLKDVDSRELAELLVFVSKEEGRAVSGEWLSTLELCAREAQGSPRQALANMGACWAAKDRKEALALLKSAQESSEAVELARALVAGKPWLPIRGILETLANEDPESVRHVVRSYVTKAIMGSNGKGQERLFAVLDEFSKPFPASDGISPLVLAVGHLLFAN